ncbi:unnamed protein product [Cochlearia groenlandica]
MGTLRHRRRRFLLAAIAVFALLHLFSAASAGELVGKKTGTDLPDRFRENKRFSGPGSAPPTCRSKCGKCNPCKPVRVTVQPGLSIPLEYYPEAWRCKCGNKVFMP